MSNLTPVEKEYQNRRKKLAYLTERIEKGQKVSQASLRWIEMLATSKLLTDFDIVDTIERIEDEIKKIKRPDERVKHLLALARLKMERRKLSFDLQETVEEKLSLESINDYLQKSRNRVQGGVDSASPRLQEQMAKLERKFLTPVDSSESDGIIRAQPSALEVFELSEDSPFKNIKKTTRVYTDEKPKPQTPLAPLGTIVEVPDLSDSKIPEELLTNDPNIPHVVKLQEKEAVANSSIAGTYEPSEESDPEPFVEKESEDIDADDTFNDEEYAITDAAISQPIHVQPVSSVNQNSSSMYAHNILVNVNSDEDEKQTSTKKEDDSIYVSFKR